MKLTTPPGAINRGFPANHIGDRPELHGAGDAGRPADCVDDESGNSAGVALFTVIASKRAERDYRDKRSENDQPRSGPAAGSSAWTARCQGRLTVRPALRGLSPAGCLFPGSRCASGDRWRSFFDRPGAWAARAGPLARLWRRGGLWHIGACAPGAPLRGAKTRGAVEMEPKSVRRTLACLTTGRIVSHIVTSLRVEHRRKAHEIASPQAGEKH